MTTARALIVVIGILAQPLRGYCLDVVLPSNGGVKLVRGASTPLPEGAVHPVPIGIKRALLADTDAGQDYSIVAGAIVAKSDALRLPDIKRTVRDEIDAMTEAAKSTTFGIYVNDKRFAFGCTVTDRSYAMSLHTAHLADELTYPIEIELVSGWGDTVSLQNSGHLLTYLRAMLAHIEDRRRDGRVLLRELKTADSIAAVEDIRSRNDARVPSE